MKVTMMIGFCVNNRDTAQEFPKSFAYLKIATSAGSYLVAQAKSTLLALRGEVRVPTLRCLIAGFTGEPSDIVGGAGEELE